MRYVILGAGAIGGALGGRLAEAGHDVVLMARGEHAEVLARDGLRLHTPGGLVHVRPEVANGAAALRLQRDDVLVSTVKSQQTQAILDEVAGLPVRGGTVAADELPFVCVQNGVVNEIEALRRFARVYGTCVMCPAEHLEPGVVVASGAPDTGVFDTGRYPSGVDDVAETFTADLSASTCAAVPREDVMAWKYAKLLRNLANALDALLGGDLDDGARAVSDDLEARAKDEARRCFAAAGIEPVSDEEWQAYCFGRAAVAPVEGFDRGGSSTWQSMTRSTGNVESDYLNGEIVLLGRRYGVATPVNLVLQRQVNALAASSGQPGDVTAEHLAELAG